MLVNLFLHYAFDVWMRRNFPSVPFERYVDDAIVHCVSEAEAELVREAIGERLAECGLRSHPDKTRIVYCKDDGQPGSFEHVSFDFLGFTFRPRLARNKNGQHFVSFLPAVSDAVAKSKRQLHRWTHVSLQDIAAFVNPMVRGWINYYGRFYRSWLIITVLQQINDYLIRWVMWKYKRLRHSRRIATRFLVRVARSRPGPVRPLVAGATLKAG